jgi:hypothetical protein
MNNPDNRSVLVVSEERAHPAVRLLARACIALAQERLAQQKQMGLAAAENKGEDALKEEPKGEEMPKRMGKAVRKKVAKKTPSKPDCAVDVPQEGDCRV